MTAPQLPPTPNDLRSPDWVMLGVAEDDGVVIYASTQLGLAQLKGLIISQPAQPVAAMFGGKAPPPLQHGYTLQAVMASFVRAWGVTYQDALRNLFAEWSPDPGHTPRALPAGARSDEPGVPAIPPPATASASTPRQWFVLDCQVCTDACDGRSAPMPFETPDARGAWAAEHKASTGHDRWRSWEEPRL